MMELKDVPDFYQKVLEAADLQARIATCGNKSKCESLMPIIESINEKNWVKKRMMSDLKERIKMFSKL